MTIKYKKPILQFVIELTVFIYYNILNIYIDIVTALSMKYTSLRYTMSPSMVFCRSSTYN